MAETTTSHLVTPPAQLWLGSADLLLAQAEQYLQQIFCPNSNCQICTVCNQMRQHQHYAVAWLAPEKQYTVDSLEIIFDTIAHALNDNQQFFFVIQKADLLTPACANRLLKSIEEPPPGYHFIFLAERRDAIIPTIRSRCTIKSFYQKNNGATPYQHLFSFFTQQPIDPSAFLKECEQASLNEHECLDFTDQLLEHWLIRHKQAIIHSDESEINTCKKMIELLVQALERPPMPGGSKLFLKNLFMQLNHSA